MVAKNNIILGDNQVEMGAKSEDLARAIINRIGLTPRKKKSTDAMHKAFLEFYEKAKEATQFKDPKRAVMTVEEMAIHAEISRQTMYEYLSRWLELNIITKVSFINSNGSVTIGYRLNGNSIEEAFKKTRTVIARHIDTTEKYIIELQKSIKNEKIAASMQQRKQLASYAEQESES